MKNYKLEIYGYWGIVKLAIYYIRTKILVPSARLIRFPIEIRGKKYIDFGVDLTTGVGCRIEAFPFQKQTNIIQFGHNIEINDYVHIAGIESISIEDNVLIASKVFITDIQHGCYNELGQQDSPISIPKERKLTAQKVVIEKNVWIGESVSILPGVTIGQGAIVGANSVVSKSLPPNVIAIGSPAKPIKKFNFDTQKWEKI